ncbi:7 transmembrane receptor (Secretin family) [Nesidiocoris tenuis]|uniref:7 transmembrane receptor (Secretin family) n=1 Tax=Nesidiocoris tenuis TaxID=355587 RepID=A0ABN7A829_9HEMI|nr:7 transmembrane receptor (Secretin family) [Nesidiocoris tenuis]
MKWERGENVEGKCRRDEEGSFVLSLNNELIIFLLSSRSAKRFVPPAMNVFHLSNAAASGAITPTDKRSGNREMYRHCPMERGIRSLLRPDTIEEEEFQLPSDSLADTDLHDHDRIDSIMYIYYGEGATGGRTGSLTVAQQAAQSPHNLQVVIVGAVVALVAQFLTLASALRRIREGDTPLTLLLNTELALTLSNLLFMLGVQATSERWTCETVAVTLHYAHLVAASWFFMNCFISFRRLQLIYTPPLVLCAVAVWLAPAPFVYISSLLNAKGYETHSYCWMSLNRSLFFTFMLPVSMLLIGSCLSVVMGLKRASKCAVDTEPDRKTLRLSAGLLPLFAVVWLLSILALDRSESLAYPLLYVVINAFLNWFVYIWWLPGDERIWRTDPQDEDYDDDFDEELLYEDPTVSKDEQALLQEQLYLIGPRETYDLQMEPISTISS